MKLIASLLLLALAVPAFAADPPKPIRALLITGGCCHDYAKQKDILKTGLEARAHIVVEQSHSDDKSTKPPLAIYGNPDYAKGYDLVIHNECAADIKDATIVDGVLAPHRAGIPSVNIHCAMHSYRVMEPVWFEYLGLQSSGHGPQEPISITNLDSEHPITAGQPEWTTIKEELYNNLKIFGTARPLQRGKQTVTSKDGTSKDVEAVITWTNMFGSTRVFNTSLGHNNATMEDPRYLDLITRGVLWSVDKLNPEYLKTAAK